MEIAEIISRPHYQNQISPYINKNIIKVIIGQRRVGKSFILLQCMAEIKKQFPQAALVYIDKEDYKNDFIRNYKDLISHIDKQFKKHKPPFFLFIDEIQDIEQFEKAIRHYHNKKNIDIYITGSNAKLLSGELATYLSGRYVEIKVYSLSYTEFQIFHKLEDNNETLYLYLKYGGLPYLKNLSLEDRIVNEYLNGIYATILFKDVANRHKIRNLHFLENLIKFTAENTGSILSAKKISDYLKSQKINVSPNIVMNYLSFLEDAFFLFCAERMDVYGKKIFEIGQKYFFEDLGLRHCLIGYRQADIQKIIENIIFIHLKIAGYNVKVGKLDNKEIDFVAAKNEQIIYVQASYLITPKNSEREFGNLLLVQDNHPKFVVSMDEMPHGESNYKGIRHLHLRKFLMLENL